MARKPRRRQQHPLKRLADQQTHGDLARLVTQTEAQIAAAFAEARGSVAGPGGILAQFAAAYAAERKRLAEEQDVDVEEVQVPVHWLVTSGWGARVRHALMRAHMDASHASRRYALHALTAAWGLGEQNARELLTVAMRPAIRAGMTSWRPK